MIQMKQLPLAVRTASSDPLLALLDTLYRSMVRRAQ
jgi:hypothetical protein